jgi:IrrE N-terminal-like domain
MSISSAEEWLCGGREAREVAVARAAVLLLHDYQRKWADAVPIKLSHLAWTLGAEIRVVDTVEGTARLIPANGGFTILVDRGVSRERARMAIAHELVHTLFYAKERGRLRRSVPLWNADMRKQEEAFCFDVGRRLLVPEWHVRLSPLRETDDGERIFRTLTTQFQVSKEVAARTMLQDYRLVNGLAGEWRRSPEGWGPAPGKFFPSASLDAAHRDMLKVVVRAYLRDGAKEAWSGSITWQHAAKDAELATAYLCCVPEVGRASAEAIVKHLGELLPRLRPESARWLLDVPGVGTKRLDAITKALSGFVTVRIVRVAESVDAVAFVLVQVHSPTLTYLEEPA